MLQPPSPPSDFRPDSPAMLQYHAQMTQYVNAKEEERLCQIPLILIDNTEGWPATLQDRPRRPRNNQKPAWGLHDPEHAREAKPRHGKSSRPCMEAGCLEPREGKKARCYAHNLQTQEREQVRNQKRKR